MAIQIKHAFTSMKGDGGDATLVRPSAWNADHSTSMNTASVVGRKSAGVGAFEEIPMSDNGAALLASTTNASFGFTTGDVKHSFKNSPDTGWIPMVGTIGNASSGANTRANEDTRALFYLLYSVAANTYFPVSGGRSGNAQVDFDAGKTMDMSAVPGRVFAQAWGFGAIGSYFGEASHTLTNAEIPTITSAGNNAISVILNGASGGQGVPVTAGSGNITSGAIGYGVGGTTSPIFPASTSGSWAGATATSNGNNNISVTSNNTSGGAHQNYQPTMAVNVFIKL